LQAPIRLALFLLAAVPVYVDTGKQAGDRDHLKIFANADVGETWLAKTVLKAWPLGTTGSK
jgi:hypothetical protein